MVALTYGDNEKNGSTISNHIIIVMTKRQCLQMRLSRREADSGSRLAKVAVIERSQIEYHPACQDRCQELLKSRCFQVQREDGL